MSLVPQLQLKNLSKYITQCIAHDITATPAIMVMEASLENSAVSVGVGEVGILSPVDLIVEVLDAERIL